MHHLATTSAVAHLHFLQQLGHTTTTLWIPPQGFPDTNIPAATTPHTQPRAICTQPANQPAMLNTMQALVRREREREGDKIMATSGHCTAPLGGGGGGGGDFSWFECKVSSFHMNNPFYTHTHTHTHTSLFVCCCCFGKQKKTVTQHLC